MSTRRDAYKHTQGQDRGWAQQHEVPADLELRRQKWGLLPSTVRAHESIVQSEFIRKQLAASETFEIDNLFANL